ncbi:MAG TPA: hypothetical protein VGL81_07015 [Polyangiaceae bacterium]
MAVATVAVALMVAPPAVADDTVRACIDASTAGQTLRQQGHLLGARDRMIACSRDACPGVVRTHCVRWLGEIDNRIPSIVVRAQDGAGNDLVDARLAIDGKAAKLDGRAVSLDPGEHVVAVDSGKLHKEERVILVEGEASRLVMLRVGPAVFGASQEAASRVQTTRVPLGAWILGGTGIAALGLATYFGVAANGQLQDLKANCSPNCSELQTRPGRTDALVFDTLLGAGGAALGVALLWALAFPSSTTVELQPVSHGGLASFAMRY